MMLPSNWFATDTSPGVIDASIAKLKETSPQLAGILETVKASSATRFIAVDTSVTQGSYPANLSVSRELRLVREQSKYIESLKTQVEAMGYSVVVGESTKINGLDALSFGITLKVPQAGGQSMEIMERGIIVDHGSDRYAVVLAYTGESARDYAGLFNQIALTFRLTAPVPTPTLVASPTPAGTPTAQELQALKEELLQLRQSAEEIRELTTKTEVDYQFITSTELPVKLLEAIDVAKEQAEAKVDQEVYVLLDLLPAGVDLFDAIIDAYSQAVAGFYDDDTDKMYVVSDTPRLDSLGKAVFVHEYTHALQDQYFDLGSLPLEDTGNADLEMAVRSLVEGDARLTEVMFLRGLSEAEMREFVERLSQMDTAKYDAIPRVVREQLNFPYEAGSGFVMALGGWDAVDKTYTDLPQSTEQIIHPEKYLQREKPQTVALPDLTGALGPGWTQRDTDVLGEFGLRVYLQTYVDAATATAAAAGWGGDHFVYLKDASDNKTLVLRSAWDSAADTQEFFDAYVAFVAKKSDGAWTSRLNEAGRKWWSSAKSSVYLSKTSGEVLLVIAPTDAIASQVLTRFPEFQ